MSLSVTGKVVKGWRARAEKAEAEKKALHEALSMLVRAVGYPSVWNPERYAKEALAVLNANRPPMPEGSPCRLHSSHYYWSEADGRWCGFCERCLSE